MKKCGFCGAEGSDEPLPGGEFYTFLDAFGENHVCPMCLETIVKAAYFGKKLEGLKRFGREFAEYVKERREEKD